jgi:hypothetical protein
MKRIIFVSLLALLLVSCATVSELVPKALASNTQDIVEQVEVNSNDVFTEIQRNIDLVSDLKTKVEKARIDGVELTIDDIIGDIQTVTYSYEKLAGQHEAITKGLLAKVAKIEDMENKVDDEINTLKDKRADYVQRLASVSDPNPDIVRTRQESLAQAIRYLDQQIILWQNFNNIEADISSELSNIQKHINSFLNVIDSSAILFREGLNLLLLQRDINDALSLFNKDLPRIDQLTSDMEKSWANLDYLISTLTSISSVRIKGVTE